METIKDYLHLYLGCNVLLCKNLEGNNVIERLTTKMLYEDDDMFDETGYKPLLRPLSSMTEEERKEVKFFVPLNKKHYLHLFADTINAAAYIKWLLSKHFDLFSLIDKGLALDSTKIKINERI